MGARRGRNKGGRGGGGGSSRTTTTTTTAHNDTTTADNLEDQKALEDRKLVASLVDWNSYNAQYGKIFYQKFGRLLEHKLEEFEATKREVKEVIRQAVGNEKALQTPKRGKPKAALHEQINRFREMNFETDEEMEDETAMGEEVDDTIRVQPAERKAQQPHQQKHQDQQATNQQNIQIKLQPTSSTDTDTAVGLVYSTPESQLKSTATGREAAREMATEAEDIVMTTPPEQQQPQAVLQQVQVTPMDHQSQLATASRMTTPSTPATPAIKRQKLGTPYHAANVNPLHSSSSMKKLAISQAMKKKAPIQMEPLVDLGGQGGGGGGGSRTGTPGKQALNTTIQKKAKLREMDEKAAKAEKIRDEQLKEKAERAKRAEEEKRTRVEQNKKQQELDRLEKEAQARQRDAAIKEFVAEQKKIQQAAAPASSPFRSPHPRAVKKPAAGAAAKKKEAARKEKEAADAAAVKKQKEEEAPPPPPQQKKQAKETAAGKEKKDKAGATSQQQTTKTAKEPELLEESPTIVSVKQMNSPPVKSTPKERVIVTAANKRKTNQENNPPPAPTKPRPGAKKSVATLQTPPLSPILPDDGVDGSELEEVSVYDMTKEKVFLPSTKDNYNVDDLSSGDETDNDEKPRKTVPAWAQKENIVRRMEAIRQLVKPDQIEHHFGRIRQPTLQDLFQGYSKNFPQRRASSATWDSPMSDPTPGVSRFQNQFQSPMPKK